MKSKGWTALGTIMGPSLFTISAILLDDFKNCEIFKMAVVRHHKYKSLMKCLLLRCDQASVLHNIRVLTIDCLDKENAEDISKLGLFCITNIDEGKTESTATMPVTIICSADPEPLELVISGEFIEMVSITMVPKDQQFRNIRMSLEDKEKYDPLTKHLGTTMSVENLDTWSKLWLVENHRTLVDFSRSEQKWPDEAFSIVLLFWEYMMPGTAIHMKAKANTDWNMRAVDEVVKQTRHNFFAYRCFVNSHLRSLWEQIDFHEEGSKDDVLGTKAVPTASPNNTGIDMNFVSGMSKINAMLTAEKNAVQLENVNLKSTLKLTLSHNRELLSQLHAAMFGEDSQRKDNMRRKLRFDNEAGNDEAAQHNCSRSIISRVDRLHGTTINMQEDLRLKLMRTTISPPQAKALPAEPAINCPDTGDDHQSSKETLKDEYEYRCLRVRGVRPPSNTSDEDDEDMVVDLREKLTAT